MPTEREQRSWLTPKRVRAHATILALCFWSVYLWNIGNPGLRDRAGNLKGTDFLHFYTLGTLGLHRDGADLYDVRTQAEIATQRVPAAAGIRYLPLYPPQVSLLFAPLARLSYGWALARWWAITALIYGVCCFSIWRVCPNLKMYGGTTLVAALAYPAFMHLVAWGQTSALALGCFTLVFFALRRERQFLAGIALGFLVFKPQLALAAAVVFIAAGAWKVLAGALVSASLEMGLGVMYYGAGPLRKWAWLLIHSGSTWPMLEPKPYQTHSLRTFWTMMIPWQNAALVLYGLSACAVLYLAIRSWRSSSLPLSLRYSILLLATVLVAPHLTVYDLVILAPVFLFVADWLNAVPRTRANQLTGTVLYLVYALPLIGPFARWTHVQFSVLAMALLLVLLSKVGYTDIKQGKGISVAQAIVR